MKHLKRFNEELDYLGRLKMETEIGRQFSQDNEKEVEKRRQEVTGKELGKIKSQNKSRKTLEEREEERREITQVVIDSIIYSNLKKKGFENFEEDLKMFLAKYPLETLPNYDGYHIFNQ